MHSHVSKSPRFVTALGSRILCLADSVGSEGHLQRGVAVRD